MQFENILEKIIDICKQIFSSNLTGIYLHGSLAMGCFNPQKSDIDLIVVVEKDITDEQKLEFMKVIVELNELAPSKGIELSVVKREVCREFVYPTPFELHFSNAHLKWFRENPFDYVAKMKGTDKDLAAHFTIINRCGIVLCGEDIDAVFSEVPKADYIDSIWFDVEGAEDEILENPMYVVLNLCRVAAYLQDDLVTSKQQGGEWGLQNLSAKFHGLVTAALECYGSEKQIVADEKVTQEFAVEMLELIKGMK